MVVDVVGGCWHWLVVVGVDGGWLWWMVVVGGRWWCL